MRWIPQRYRRLDHSGLRWNFDTLMMVSLLPASSLGGIVGSTAIMVSLLPASSLGGIVGSTATIAVNLEGESGETKGQP